LRLAELVAGKSDHHHALGTIFEISIRRRWRPSKQMFFDIENKNTCSTAAANPVISEPVLDDITSLRLTAASNELPGSVIAADRERLADEHSQPVGIPALASSTCRLPCLAASGHRGRQQDLQRWRESCWCRPGRIVEPAAQAGPDSGAPQRRWRPLASNEMPRSEATWLRMKSGLAGFPKSCTGLWCSGNFMSTEHDGLLQTSHSTRLLDLSLCSLSSRRPVCKLSNLTTS
jgi:hypothetical protein